MIHFELLISSLLTSRNLKTFKHLASLFLVKFFGLNLTLVMFQKQSSYSYLDIFFNFLLRQDIRKKTIIYIIKIMEWNKTINQFTQNVKQNLKI